MTERDKIYTEISEDISVSVTPHYEVRDSKPSLGRFVFSYLINIQNLGNRRIKLISRHWYVEDSIRNKREIKGEGVVGQLPEIMPGGLFDYTSWTLINSPVGKMYGTYKFRNLDTGETFLAKIPVFLLSADFILN